MELSKQIELRLKELTKGNDDPNKNPFGDTDNETLQKKRIENSISDFFLFCTTYFPEYFFKPFGGYLGGPHQRVIDKINSTKKHEVKLIPFGGPREIGKTALMRPAYLCWLGITGNKHHIPFLCNDVTAASDHLEFARIEFKSNRKLIWDFGHLINPNWDTYGDFSVYNFNGQNKDFRPETRFIAVGPDSNIKALTSYKQYRWDFGIMEDFEDYKDSANPDIVKERLEWLDNTFRTSFTAGSAILWNANNSRMNSAFDKTVKNAKKLKGIDPLIIPAYYEVGGKRISCWIGKTMKEWDQVRESVGLTTWLGTYMQEPVVMGEIFKAEYFRYFDSLPNDLIIYGRLDPARGKSRSADTKALALLGWSPSTKLFYLCDGFCFNGTVGKMVRMTYQLFIEWEERGLVSLEMEGDFGQYDLLDDFELASEEFGFYLPLGLYESRGEGDKESRIVALEGPFERSLILFPKDWQTHPGLNLGINQLLAFPSGKKDFPDALSRAYRDLNKVAMAYRPNRTEQKYQSLSQRELSEL